MRDFATFRSLVGRGCGKIDLGITLFFLGGERRGESVLQLLVLHNLQNIVWKIQAPKFQVAAARMM